MSQAFPTHRQFIIATRAALRKEYPEGEPENIEACVQVQTTKQAWLTHLGRLLAQGVPATVSTLDTLTIDQLVTLKRDEAPYEALDWYIPRQFRTGTTISLFS